MRTAGEVSPAGESGCTGGSHPFDSALRGAFYAVLFSMPAWGAVCLTVMNYTLLA